MIAEIKDGNPEMMADPTLKRWHDMMAAGAERGAEGRDGADHRAGQQEAAAAIMDPKFAKSRLAEEHRDHGEVQRARALHRVHRLRVDLECRRRQQPAPQRHLPRRQGQGRPGAAATPPSQSENPEDLWKWMADWEKKTGGKLLAIPHNGNLSNGRMFELDDVRRQAARQATGPRRAQLGAAVRGHPDQGRRANRTRRCRRTTSSPDFELWDRGNLDAGAEEARR